MQRDEVDRIGLSEKDRCLVQLYIAASASQWSSLPSFAKAFYSAEGTAEELRGCLRHLIVLAGYGPCLAANLTLQKAKLLPENTPGKVGGPPGDAFELVYAQVTDAVRQRVHSADPVLGEWIRLHLYGDVYSSPGIDLRVKQLLMCARLSQADMQEQLFGHALAALRFGNSRPQLEEAIELAFQTGPSPREGSKEESIRTLGMAYAKYKKDFLNVPPSVPCITVPDEESVCIPEFGGGRYQPIGHFNGTEPKKQQHLNNDTVYKEDDGNGAKGNAAGIDGIHTTQQQATDERDEEEDAYKDVLFVWEELELERKK